MVFLLKKLNPLIANSDLLQVTELLDTLQNILLIIFPFYSITLNCKMNAQLICISILYTSLFLFYISQQKNAQKRKMPAY